MSSLKLENISKKFGETVAVKDLDLNIEEGDFVVLLGPSGCGKTTTLRIVAGLEEQDRGDVIIDGENVNKLEPKERDVAMVFQTYALYPHLTAYENMEFPLKMRDIPEEERDKRIKENAELMGIDHLLDSKPRAMSGGQRQRVALGRAIVRDPKAFLLDEPLANLDARLRIHMRTELRKLHDRLHTTTLYVTHDQTEAMTLADKIAVLKEGELNQYSTPKELYNSPDTAFVGKFVGDIPMNMVEGSVEEKDSTLLIDTGYFEYQIEDEKIIKDYENADKPTEILLGFRGEDVNVKKIGARKEEEKRKNTYTFSLYVIEELGNENILNINLGADEEKTIKVKSEKSFASEPGENITFQIPEQAIHMFDKKSEESIIR